MKIEELINNNELTEKGKKWMEKLNSYSEKCKKINSCEPFDTEKDFNDLLKKITDENGNIKKSELCKICSFKVDNSELTR